MSSLRDTMLISRINRSYTQGSSAISVQSLAGVSAAKRVDDALRQDSSQGMPFVSMRF